MSTRAELEAMLARTETDWRKAEDALNKARAERDRAEADWDKVLADRRKSESDRRKPGSVWDKEFPDRRNAGADRRRAEAAFAAFAKAVSDRHQAYIGRDKAVADCAMAEARLNTANAARKHAIAALEALEREQGKR